MRAVILPVTLLLAACGLDRIEGELSREQAVERMQACNLLWREEEFGRVMQSPISGRVDQVAFDALGPAKQRRLAELAACLRSRGRVEPMPIQIHVSGRNLKLINAANDLDFAKEV